jgi:hypothetical protein
MKFATTMRKAMEILDLVGAAVTPMRLWTKCKLFPIDSM